MVRIPYIKIPSVRVGSIVPTSNIGTGGATPAPPTPITYLTQWKIVGNSEVHGQEIWSCGEYNATDGKYHILVQPQGGSIADIALDAPLRKVNNVADTIEFPSETEGYAVVTRNVESKTVSAYNDADGNQVATTLPDDTILHIQNLYDYSGSITKIGTDFVSHSQRETEVKVANSSAGSYLGFQLPYSSGKKYYCSCQMKNSVSKYNFIYSNGGSSGGTVSSNYTKQSILSNTNLTYCRFATNANSGSWVNDDIFFVKDINIFNVDAMFADCTDLKPTSNTAFETLFPNLGCIDRINATIDVIVKDGKLYKEDETGIEILVPLTTPTTELIDAPQIEEADSYSMAISQGAKAVEWSSFETNSE